MAMKTLSLNNLRWIHIDAVDDEALAYLKKEFRFHDLDLEDVRGESQSPKIDTYKEYLFLVLQFPNWNGLQKKVIAQEVNIFIGKGYLITIQHGKSKEMKKFFYRCQRNSNVKKDWMSKSSGYLLYRLLLSLYKESHPILNNIGKQLTLIEHEIFEGEQRADTVKELAIHRRNILNFRRIIDPQRYLISNLSHIRKAFLNEETTLYFDDISDYLNKVWAIVDRYKDTVQGLHVTVESLLTQRTNKVVSMLTIISVALLPFTVLSSMYGMNIASLPYANNPMAIWAMFGILFFLIIIVIILMRKKRWL